MAVSPAEPYAASTNANITAAKAKALTVLQHNANKAKFPPGAPNSADAATSGAPRDLSEALNEEIKNRYKKSAYQTGFPLLVWMSLLTCSALASHEAR